MLFFLDFSSALKNSVLPVLDSLVKLVQWISENVFGKFISSGSAVGWMLGTYLKYKALSFFFGLGFVQAILWKLIMTFPLFTISALLSLQSIGEGVVAFGALLWSSIIKPLALFAAGAFVLIMVLDLLLAAFMKLGEYFGGEKYSYEKHSLVNKTMGLAGLDVKGIGKKFFETDEGGTLAGGGIRQSKQGMGAPPEHGNTYDANLTIGGQTFTPGMLEDMLKAANNRSMDPTEQAALLKDIAAAVRGQQTQGSTAGYPIMIDP
jgi:hypothetical protein